MSWLAHSEMIDGPHPERQDGVSVFHGLLTSSNGWQEFLANWGDMNTNASWSWLNYWEGLFGTGHGQHLSDTIDGLVKMTAQRPRFRHHAIGHSNGCLLLMQALAASPGLYLGDLHLIAAYAARDCIKNGLNAIVNSGQVKRVFLYVSSADDVLWINWFNDYQLGKWGTKNASPSPVQIALADVVAGVGANRFVQANDNTKTHCGWTDPTGNDPGFNLSMMRTPVALSLGVAA